MFLDFFFFFLNKIHHKIQNKRMMSLPKTSEIQTKKKTKKLIWDKNNCIISFFFFFLLLFAIFVIINFHNVVTRSLLFSPLFVVGVRRKKKGVKRRKGESSRGNPFVFLD